MSGTYDRLYGLIPDESEGWVPSPNYLLRRACMLEHLHKFALSQSVLEVGCGAGALIADFRRKGHRVTAVETSPTALAAARKLHSGDALVRFRDDLDPLWNECFDFLFAFEVLEHIEDDKAALREWVRSLRPGGTIVVSMPGGPHRWDASDEWAGHFRRYTRKDLVELANQGGAEVQSIQSYGFPLANLISPIRARTKVNLGAAESTAARTADSGIVRSPERKLLPFLLTHPGRLLLRTCFLLQKLAANTNMGPGYLMVARKT